MSDKSNSHACRDCFSRREFLARTAGGAALVVLAACGDSPTVPTSEQISITVASFPGLATVGNLVKVGPSHAAKRTGAESFLAYSMFCTHQGCETFLSGGQFLCPCHGSRFNSDGSVLQGPAARSLAKLTTSYDAATDTLTIS
ncbi:MAG TPA: ubiquinol-cytochrome c reductase iron-sulfur subunit [Gemmatimonadaceae bacterium]